MKRKIEDKKSKSSDVDGKKIDFKKDVDKMDNNIMKINNKSDSNLAKKTKFLKNKKVKKDEMIDNNSIASKGIEFNVLEVVIIVLISGVFISLFTAVIVYNRLEHNDNEIKNVLGTSNVKLKEFEDNYNTIVNNYVSEVDNSALIDAAISGMYNFLGDANTFYVDKSNNDTLQDTLAGEYEGIGVEITTSYREDGTFSTYISRVFKDSSASRAGLQVGDVFINLNGVDLSDKDSSYVADIIKNGAQTDNTIVVLRNGEIITLNIKREHIYIDSVHSELKNGVGYIQLETFSLTTADQVKKAIDSFDSSVKSLVIDLRDNGGGYTVSAFDTANLFVEKNKNIYQMKDRNSQITYYPADTGIYRKFDKIAVLVNGSSASSSEIVALALKESAGATIVGTQSFGKGSVQETKQLSSGAMVKYTIAYWLSPNGNSINNVGIVPDIIDDNADTQLDTAINFVK